MVNYNILYLKGHRHITDAKYCEVKGLSPELAGTPEINNEFIRENDNNKEIVEMALAQAGLLNGETNGKEEL